MDPFCVSCGSPFEFKVEEKLVCAPCLEKPPIYNNARASVRYTTTSRHLLMSFKHGDMLQISKIMARLMAHAGADLIKLADLMVPVPLHPWRLFWRQYNQSALLVDEIMKLSELPRENELLGRSRHTPSQGKRKVKDRRKNVKTAFKVNPRFKDTLRGKRILLVDDVLTTGATVDECSKVLKKAGAKTVDVLTFARVTKPVGHL